MSESLDRLQHLLDEALADVTKSLEAPAGSDQRKQLDAAKERLERSLDELEALARLIATRLTGDNGGQN